MFTQTELLDQVEAHLRAKGVAETSFGRAVANDPHLVRQLRSGREPRSSLRERIIQALSAEPQRA